MITQARHALARAVPLLFSPPPETSDRIAVPLDENPAKENQMTSDAEDRLERLSNEILPKFQELSEKLLSLAALQITHPADPAVRELVAAVEKELEALQPRLDELKLALDAANLQR